MCVWEISLKYPFSFTARSLFSFNKRSGILSLHIRTIFFFNFHCLRQQKRIFLREIYLWWKQLQMIKMWWGKINQAILFAYLCVELTMLLSKSWNGKYLIPYFYDNIKTNIKNFLLYLSRGSLEQLIDSHLLYAYFSHYLNNLIFLFD